MTAGPRVLLACALACATPLSPSAGHAQEVDVRTSAQGLTFSDPSVAGLRSYTTVFTSIAACVPVGQRLEVGLRLARGRAAPSPTGGSRVTRCG